MWSLNEVAGMVQKAAIGAGFPLGQAEDLGHVAFYLAGIGSDLRPVTRALQEEMHAVDVRWTPDAMTIVSGPVVLIAPCVRDAFAMGCKVVTLADVAHAPLVAAYLAAEGTAQAWDGLEVRRSDTEILPVTYKPLTIPKSDWSVWNALAARTYVPETAASRRAGAGAGLTDND